MGIDVKADISMLLTIFLLSLLVLFLVPWPVTMCTHVAPSCPHILLLYSSCKHHSALTDCSYCHAQTPCACPLLTFTCNLGYCRGSLCCVLVHWAACMKLCEELSCLVLIACSQLSLTHAHCLQILGALHAIHAVAVFFKVMSPALYSPGVSRTPMYTLVILNSLNLAVACR